LNLFNVLVVVIGAGDLGSGVVHKLAKSGFRVAILEQNKPSSVRRKVSFSEAVYEKVMEVEGVVAEFAEDKTDIDTIFSKGHLPVLVGSVEKIIKDLKPDVVVDAIVAKRNLGTNIGMADITIALGPGFTADKDVHAVIETERGHNLGKVIMEGSAAENTGRPGNVLGYERERILWPPADGYIKHLDKVDIGAFIKKGDIVAYVDDKEVHANISGIIRGLRREGVYIKKGRKIGDIDPRENALEYCYTISDKARSVAGGVLEAILYFMNKM